jgi:hypothetical protein
MEFIANPQILFIGKIKDYKNLFIKKRNHNIHNLIYPWDYITT